MPYRMRWTINIDFIPAGMGLALNNDRKGKYGTGPAQTVEIFNSTGASMPVSTTFTNTDVTNMLATMTTDATNQLDAPALQTQIQNFATGGG